MSISQNFPSTRPSLNLNFARSQKLDPRITFTRSSSATYTGGDGLIKSAATNTPRFDFNATTGDCLGLLIEESRTNLITYSDYSSGNSLSNVTLTANATTAPDGTNTAVSMTGNAGTSVKYMYKGYSTTTTGTYTTSVFAKYNGEQYILLRVNDNTGVNDGQQRFDILNGIKDGNVANGGTATGASSTITPYPNGWYRLTVTCTFNSALTQLQGTSVYLTGYTSTSSTNSVYLWAPQLETGAFPTSYIPTVASTVTRSADNASITGTNFSSFYNPDEGSVSAKFKFYENHGPYSEAVSIAGSSAGFMVIDVAGGLVTDCYGANTVVTGGNNARNTFVTGVRAYKFSTNDSVIGCSGASSITTQTGTKTNPNPTTMQLGRRGDGGGSVYMLNGHLQQVSYYPVRLSNSQLQSLTK
jgi:hypothetical protein